MANAFANFVDRIGTALNAKEMGWSEALAGGGPTVYTGVNKQSAAVYGPRNSTSYQAQFYPQQYQSRYTPQQSTPNSTTQTTGGSPGSYGGPAPVPSNNNGNNGGDPQGQAIDDYRSQQEGIINRQYDSYRSYLNDLIGGLPGELQQYNDLIGNQFDTQKTDITTGQTNALTDLGRSSEKVIANKATSFKDLAENLRNSLSGANNYLGVLGAADSSAAKQYAYALSKASNKQQAGIMRDVNSQLADIRTREEKVNTTAQGELEKLNKWKSDQLISAKQFIDSKKAELQQRIANGELDRGTALRELNTQVFPAVMSRLQQVDQEVKGYRDSIMQFAMDNMSSINAAKAQLGQLSNVSTPEYVTQQLNYLPQYAQAADSVMSGLVPSLFGKKEDNTRFQFAG